MKQLVTLKVDKQLLRAFDSSARFRHLTRTDWIIQLGRAAVMQDIKEGLRLKEPANNTDRRRRAA